MLPFFPTTDQVTMQTETIVRSYNITITGYFVFNPINAEQGYSRYSENSIIVNLSLFDVLNEELEVEGIGGIYRYVYDEDGYDDEYVLLQCQQINSFIVVAR